VILGQAMDQRLVDRTTGRALLVAATLSMISIPLLAALGARIGGRKISPADLPDAQGDAPADRGC